jgi:hypothetical protein
MPAEDWHRFLKTYIMTPAVCRAIPPDMTCEEFGRRLHRMLSRRTPPDQRGPAYSELVHLLGTPWGWRLLNLVCNEQVPESCR